jgi:hypothetical protein
MTTRSEMLFGSAEELQRYVQRQNDLRQFTGMTSSFQASWNEGYVVNGRLVDSNGTQVDGDGSGSTGPASKDTSAGESKPVKRKRQSSTIKKEAKNTKSQTKKKANATTGPRRKPARTQIGNFEGFLPRTAPIPGDLAEDGMPRDLNLYEICQRYPNHLWSNVFDPFLQRQWSAKEIFNSLPQSVIDSVLERRKGAPAGNSPEMFLTKRRSARYHKLQEPENSERWNKLIRPTIGDHPTFLREDGRPDDLTRYSSATKVWEEDDLHYDDDGEDEVEDGAGVGDETNNDDEDEEDAPGEDDNDAQGRDDTEGAN